MPIQGILLAFAALVLLGTPGHSQQLADSAAEKAMRLKDSSIARIHQAQQVPVKYATDIESKAQALSSSVSSQSQKYLSRLSRLESKILGKLQRVYPSAANSLSQGSYGQLAASIQNGTASPLQKGFLSAYDAHLDSLKTSLSFLQSNPAFLTSGATQQVNQASTSVSTLEGQFNNAAMAEQYIQQRMQSLSQLLSQYHLPAGITNLLNQYQETGYYYKQQMQAYQGMLDDPDQAEKVALGILSRTSVFQSFFGQNSQFASLFPQPASPLGSTSASLTGLQTRSQVQQMVQQQLSAGGQTDPQAVQAQLSQAQGQVFPPMPGLPGAGGGQSSTSSSLPDGFTPNSQKTKTFLKRIEFGANIQFAQPTSVYFPSTANIAGTVGYKINDKSTIGVGLSYVAGMGTGWNHIQFSNQGLGLRSFMDWKIRGTWYVTGGYEMNYLLQFTSIPELQDQQAWQKSALIGLEKKYKISSKLQGNVQLLFDMLYKTEIPQGQMIKFRVGYNF